MGRKTNSSKILLQGLKESFNAGQVPDYPILQGYISEELTEQVKELEARLGLMLQEFSIHYIDDQYRYELLFGFFDATLQSMGMVGALSQIESVLFSREAKIRVGLMNLGLLIEATI